MFALALSVRLLHLVQIRHAPFFTLLLGDSNGYDVWAQRIAAGDWVGDGVFYQAPLYPYLLGVAYRILDRDLMAVRIVQAIFGAAATVLIAFATRRLFGNRAGLAAGIVFAFYAPAVFFDGLIQKASLDLVLMAGLIVLVTFAIEVGRRTKGLVFAIGVTLGTLVLSRENALILVPIFVAWLWRVMPGWRAVGSFLLGLGLMLAPVALRNYVVAGELHLTTAQSGPNFYIGNHEGATGTYEPLRKGRGNVVYEQRDARELAEAAMGRTMTASEVSDYWTRRAFDWITGNPVDWFALIGRKTLLALNAVEWTDTEDLYSHAEWSPLLRGLAVVFHLGVLLPLSVLGLWITRERWRSLSVLYLVLVAYFLSLLAFYVVARYRVPLVPSLIMFAGAALAGAPAWWVRANQRDKVIGVAIVLVTASIANWPLHPIAPMRALTHYNMAVAMREAGRRADAIGELRAAIELDPTNAAAHSNLGALLALNGDHDQALRLQRRAVELDPNNAVALNNLGQELALGGDLNEAIACFRRSIELDPLAGDTHSSLGLTLAGSGQTEEAISEFEQTLRLDPSNANAHNNLGILLASSNRLAEGVEHFRAALHLKPDLSEAALNLSRAQALLKTQTDANPRRR